MLTFCLWELSIFLLASEFASNQVLSSALQVGGNIIGGLLGGIVAYYVAKYQLDRQEQERQKLRQEEIYGRLSLIKQELTRNEQIISKALTVENLTIDSLQASLDDSIWHNFGYWIYINYNGLYNIKDSLYKIYTKLGLLKIMNPREITNKRLVDLDKLIINVNNDIDKSLEKLSEQHLS